MEQCSSQLCSPWVRRFASTIVAGGRVLDLACGAGRHARLLADLGYHVEAVDIDAAAIASLRGIKGVSARVVDLEGGPWPYYGFAFDGIVVTNYLHRALLPLIINAVAEGGVLIYETFMVGNERFGRPSNSNFLLRRSELLDVVHRKLNVLAFEQGEIGEPQPAMVQRLCAVQGNVVAIPPTPA